MAVMNALAMHAPMSAPQVAEKLSLERTIVHRILRTLEDESMVEREGNQFRLGPRLLLFANSYVAYQGLRQACLPYQVEFLHRTFANEPWALAVMVRVGRAVTLVSQLVSPASPLESLLAVGSTAAVDRTAAGRAMLAYEPDEVLEGLFDSERLEAIAPLLATIREQGAVDFVRPAERIGAPPDLSALAVCIRGRDGRPIGALTLSGARLDEHLHPTSAPAMHLRAIAEQVGTSRRAI